MYCIECGNKLESTDKFCPSCGTAKSEPQSEAQPDAQQQADMHPQSEAQLQTQVQPPVQTQIQPQTYDYAPQTPMPPVNAGSSKSTMKIVLGVGIPVFAVTAAIIILFASGVFGGIVGTPLTGNFTDILRINRDAVPIADAIDIMIEEADLRMETTPLQAIPALFETLEDGTLSVNFNLRDDSLWGFGGADGSVILRSDTRNSEFALEADFRMMGFINLDAAAFFNNERIAVGSSLFGSDLYGITFSTFAEDFRIFGRAIGLRPAEIEDIIASVEVYLDDIYTAETDVSISILEVAQYAVVLSNFIRDLEFVSENSAIMVSGEQTNATRISTAINTSDLFALLTDLLEVAESDNRFMPWIFGDIFNGESNDSSQIFREALEDLRALEAEVEIDFSFAFYIGQDGRLLRVVADIDYTEDDVSTYSTTTIGFGASYNDNWTLDVMIIDMWGRSTVVLDWDIEETPQEYQHNLTISVGGALFTESVTLSSLWTPDTGRFTLSYLEHRWDDFGSISGTLDLGADTLTILLDDFELGFGQSLSLEIVSEHGANIPEIEYINLDQWDMVLMALIEDLLRTFGLGGFGFDGFEFW
ncbi:MAG: zinc ribbon domain-containing protein [Oscillospiraceae bacterium]|nr:zinc ribbon domain-containing protein [Oscillospiraceae bacterium]